MSRADRQALNKALQAFEALAASGSSNPFGNEVMEAAMNWEILLNKHQQFISERTLSHLKRRAKAALDKAMRA